MPHYSDTESEPESLFARNASDILPSRSNDSQNAENSASAMKVAVEMLKNIDRSAVSQVGWRVIGPTQTKREND